MSQEEIVVILKKANKEGRKDGLTIIEIHERIMKEMEEEISKLAIHNSLSSMLKFGEVARAEFFNNIDGKHWREYRWMLVEI